MKKLTWLIGFTTITLATPIFAQNVPALKLGEGEALPAVQMLSNNKVLLDKKEKYGITLANEWKKHPDKPRRGPDGSVKYLFGATLPTLICSPLQVCAVQLQEGEIVKDLKLGDKVRWLPTPAKMGSGANAATLIIFKPTDAGLSTNLIITTDRRLYSIKLVSTKKDWMPVLSFDYPDDVERAWSDYQADQTKQVYNNTMPTGQNLANLDFDFHMSGDTPSWKPIRVYTDGSKTYIQFSSATFNGEAPALVSLANDGGFFSSPSEQIVNYRVIGDRYIVDNVLERAALIVGVGDKQTKVTITRGSK